jgi:ADP-ribose pyrophosphatase YjhB (NUDIX family)
LEREYPTRPIAGVGAVIVVTERERELIGLTKPVPSPSGVLLIRRRFEPLAGRWSLPGGTLEIGETLEAGIAREVEEETGLVVDVGEVVDVFDRIIRDDEGRVRYHFVLVDYLCRPIGGRLAAGSDVSDVDIADPADLAPYDLTGKAIEVIDRTYARLRARSDV